MTNANKLFTMGFNNRKLTQLSGKAIYFSMNTVLVILVVFSEDNFSGFDCH